MARLTIEIEENRASLYDVSLYFNGLFYWDDVNYTSEQLAYEVALLKGREAWSND